MLSYLRLTRASLAPTLAADLAAGAACAAMVWPDSLGVLVRALPASLALFVGGMCLNARVDVEDDARTRPDRPLPSGTIPKSHATWGAVGGLAGAPLLAAGLLDGFGPAAWVLGLAVLILMYHGPVRRSGVLGPVTLGSIRGGHLAFGVMAAGGYPLAGFEPLAYGVYVLGASLVAHQEDRDGGDGKIRAGLLLCAAAVLAILAAGYLRADEPGELRLAGLAILTGWFPLRTALGAFRGATAFRSRPGGVGALAGRLLGSMALVGAAIAWAQQSWELGLIALVAFAAVRLLVRWIPPT